MKKTHSESEVNLQYWIDTTECICNSPYPIGGCLHCDLIRFQKQNEKRRNRVYEFFSRMLELRKLGRKK